MATFRIDGVLDIECAHWTHYKCGALYEPRRGVQMTRTPGDLVDKLLDRGGWWWAWFGGRYDFLAILHELHERGARIRAHTSGGQITRLVAGDLVLVDAYFLVPMSKRAAAPMAGRPAAELPWPCVCAAPGQKECGGYCNIAPRMSPAMERTLEEYCAHDAHLEYDILAAVIREFTANGMHLRGTLGGTAWATAQAVLGIPDAVHRSSTWKRLRTAYYGGRVTCGRARAQHGNQWDLASAYPAALATTPVPVGEPIELGARRARLALGASMEGVYRATVRVPETRYLPPLPWRHAGRIAYPTGVMTGVWCRPELEAAIARGVTVEDVHGAIVYPDGARVLFDDLIGTWYTARAKVGRRSAMGELWRLVANALVGKFAEGPHREMVLVRPRRVVACDARSRRARAAGCTRTRCTGQCGRYRQLDRWGLIWSVPYWRQADSGHLPWAIYTVAATRLKWLDGAELVGESFVYGDTDSVLAAAPEVDLEREQFGLRLDGAGVTPPGEVGERMGQWAWKGSWYDWHCLGLKNYRYDTDVETIIKAAGVSHASLREWQALDGTDRALVQGRGVMSLKEAAASADEPGSGGKGLFRRRFRPVTPRELDGWYGDRLLASDGRTYPVTRGQIQERYEAQRRRHRRFIPEPREDGGGQGQESGFVAAP